MRDANVEKLLETVREVRQERVDNRRKRRIIDRKADAEDAKVHAFTQHPDLWDEKDDKPAAVKFFAKVKEVSGNLLKGKIDWAAVKKWLSENWLKVIQIIVSIFGLALMVGS